MDMEKTLGRPAGFFEAQGAGNTAREILQQPDMWRKLAGILLGAKAEIATFMEKLMAVKGLRIVFTGAGSSAFIGESLQGILARELGVRSETVHTTDIVSAPDCVLFNVPTLLISFSRSGESPESVGALQYANARIDELYNIVVVCKPDSSLANYASSISDTLVLNMPPETSDLGFAMTSSVSSMALAAWSIFDWKNLAERCRQMELLAQSAEAELAPMDALARTVAGWAYDRVVFLGSGGLKGLARESAVKSLELTDGIVNAGYDTAAGFRHGPKTAVTDSMLTVHFLSADSFTRQYDVDLLREMAAEKQKNLLVAVGSGGAAECPQGVDGVCSYELCGEAAFADMTAYIKSLLFAQLLSLEKSLECGITTDTPCAGGTVNRVVQGVVVYQL